MCGRKEVTRARQPLSKLRWRNFNQNPESGQRQFSSTRLTPSHGPAALAPSFRETLASTSAVSRRSACPPLPRSHSPQAAPAAVLQLPPRQRLPLLPSVPLVFLLLTLGRSPGRRPSLLAHWRAVTYRIFAATRPGAFLRCRRHFAAGFVFRIVKRRSNSRCRRNYPLAM